MTENEALLRSGRKVGNLTGDFWIKEDVPGTVDILGTEKVSGTKDVLVTENDTVTKGLPVTETWMEAKKFQDGSADEKGNSGRQRIEVNRFLSRLLNEALYQPGSPDSTIQCFVRRDRTSRSTVYHLCLGLPPCLTEERTSLLFAKKVRHATCSEFLISVDPNDISCSSSSYVGKLRSNFLGTKFSIYDNHTSRSAKNTVHATNHTTSIASQLMPHGRSRRKQNIARITYELNILGVSPRKMQCTLNTIPSSAMDNPRDFSMRFSTGSFRIDDPISSGRFSNSMRSRAAVADWTSEDLEESISTGIGLLIKDRPLVLKSKAPRWHKQLKCWCLNFRGRVTVSSVKNFQLVAGTYPRAEPRADQDKILLQFGKIGKDMFTMDYTYPLSAFQAFAICLTSFDNKLVCDSKHTCFS